MAFELVLFTRVEDLRLLFLFAFFFVKRWLPKAFLRLTLPVEVFLNRFAAPLFVFIFGTTSLPQLCSFPSKAHEGKGKILKIRKYTRI
jgi:hypothetical protein